MKELEKKIESIVSELEDIQAKVGNTQKELIDLLLNETLEEFDEQIQTSLIILERVQCTIGDSQLALQPHHPEIRVEPPSAPSKYAPIAEPLSAPSQIIPTVAQSNATLQTSPMVMLTPPTQTRTPGTEWTDPRAWLAEHHIMLLKVGEPAQFDTPAGHAAWMLGQNFEALFDFYSLLKRHASGTNAEKSFSLRKLDNSKCQIIHGFANALAAKGFLARHHHDKREEKIYFEPQNLSEIQNFLTGGWLEQYTLLLLKKYASEIYGGWDDKFALMNAKVAFADGKNSELDLLIGLPHEQILWIECKSGEWASFIKNYRVKKQEYLKLPKSHSALILVDPKADLTSASNLTQMTALRLQDLPNWLSQLMHATTVMESR